MILAGPLAAGLLYLAAVLLLVDAAPGERVQTNSSTAVVGIRLRSSEKGSSNGKPASELGVASSKCGANLARAVRWARAATRHAGRRQPRHAEGGQQHREVANRVDRCAGGEGELSHAIGRTVAPGRAILRSNLSRSNF